MKKVIVFIMFFLFPVIGFSQNDRKAMEDDISELEELISKEKSQPKKEEPKPEVKAEEVKTEEVKAEPVAEEKTEEKAEEAKMDETKGEEAKGEEAKAEESVNREEEVVATEKSPQNNINIMIGSSSYSCTMTKGPVPASASSIAAVDQSVPIERIGSDEEESESEEEPSFEE